ncbi:helix-turn-helix domain-containing protein [Brucella sp. 21LCYQ03]|nr:helix-turn-helix domain-containing protein [Brucella sp. 21LCYQ03]
MNNIKSIENETDILDDLADEAEAATILRQAPRTLTVWRCQGRGPIFLKLGRKVFYRRSDLRRWVAAQTIKPEAQSHAS